MKCKPGQLQKRNSKKEDDTKKDKNKKKWHFSLKNLLLIFGLLCLAVAVLFVSVNAHVLRVSSPRLISADAATNLENVDCILVLGSSVQPNGTLNRVVRERVDTALTLYENGVSQRLLMSGDHGKVNYDEVNAMKQYCVDKGVNPDVIFLDHAGFNTYDSIYRAKAIFGIQKMIIVSQEYHLYRAVYIANELGIEAYGVPAEQEANTALITNLRESVARVKDYFSCAFHIEPTVLGEPIPISGSAKLSDDKEYV